MPPVLAPALGDLELAVLEVLWQTDRADAKAVHSALGSARGIGLNTVQSTLERLFRKQLLAREPSAFLHFTLGNLYADQGRWPAAQQAWFQAHALEPANPDYAFNLALGLERMAQLRLAADFYRRALELAAASGRAGFDPSVVRERVRLLETAQ